MAGSSSSIDAHVVGQQASSSGSPVPALQQALRDGAPVRLLFEKKLSFSDVSPSRRNILIPKKVAEEQMPKLEKPDGILLPMRDVHTGEIWNFHYIYWARSTNRLSFLLANTYGFVVRHGLLPQDSIKVYTNDRGDYFVEACN